MIFQGSGAKGEIAKTLDHFKNTRLYKELKDFLQTPKGADVLAKFEQAAETYCEDIVSELQGVADGAGVTYRDVTARNHSDACIETHYRSFRKIPT